LVQRLLNFSRQSHCCHYSCQPIEGPIVGVEGHPLEDTLGTNWEHPKDPREGGEATSGLDVSHSRQSRVSKVWWLRGTQRHTWLSVLSQAVRAIRESPWQRPAEVSWHRRSLQSLVAVPRCSPSSMMIMGTPVAVPSCSPSLQSLVAVPRYSAPLECLVAVVPRCGPLLPFPCRHAPLQSPVSVPRSLVAVPRRSPSSQSLLPSRSLIAVSLQCICGLPAKRLMATQKVRNFGLKKKSKLTLWRTKVTYFRTQLLHTPPPPPQ
jgi:hypothetical protein